MRDLEKSQSMSAFTRLEFLAALFSVGVLCMLALPMLANTRPRSDRVTCLNNLRRIGHAEHLWAIEHNDQMPWWVDLSEGGTRGANLQNNVWFNYGIMTNELVTPMILACPSDPGTRMARDFSALAGGFFHSGNKNNSVSYFIGLHSFLTSADWSLGYGRGVVQKAMAGDRNLRPTALNQSCESGPTVAAAVLPGSSQAAWTNAIHGVVGNVLMIDGQVLQSSNARFLDVIAPSALGAGYPVHLLMPH